jgi:hypothetical protein
VTVNTVLACAVCMGASDSPLAQGMNAGVLLLLAVTLSVLAAIVGVAIVIGRRSRALGAEP